MTIKRIGSRVRISQDCREGGTATGAYGIYEGDYPLTALVHFNGEDKEVMYRSFIFSEYPKLIPHWERGQPKPDGNYWLEIDNPRIRLDDGSTIWGVECWWAVIDGDDPPLETLQEGQRQTQEILRALAGYLKHSEETTG